MPNTYVYPLRQGFVHNWLVADLCGDLASAPMETLAVDGDPCEQSESTVRVDGAETQVKWRYLHTADDHLLDPWHGRWPGRHACRTLAYCQIETRNEQLVELGLCATGAATLWLNGEALLTRDASQPWTTLSSASLALRPGANTLLIAYDMAPGDTWQAMALSLHSEARSKLSVVLPTESRFTLKQPVIERFAQEAIVQRDVFAADDHITVRWPSSAKSQQKLLVRVMWPEGAVHAQAEPDAKALETLEFSESMSAKDGRYVLRIGGEYEDLIRGLSAHRDHSINLLHADHRYAPDSDRAERTAEMLQHTVWWTQGIWSEVAQTALEWWDKLDAVVVNKSGQAVADREPGWAHDLVGLLVLAFRCQGRNDLPEGLADAIDNALASANPALGVDLDSGPGLLCIAGALLLTVLVPERADDLAWSTEMVWRWLRRRALGGFASWDSAEEMESVVLGLTAIIDYVEDQALAEMAATVLDKALLTVALGSWQGVYGATSEAGDPASVVDGRLGATAPLCRLLWGAGCWNRHMGAAVVLGSSQAYEYPSLFQPIALLEDGATISRQQHVTRWSEDDGLEGVREAVNTVTYRRPEYMLSSAQSFRAGEPGGTEQVWQAVLGPKTLIHVNHPGTMGQRDNGLPGFWRGNVVMPRVAQHENLLIALHRLPANDWLGYTHARFPVAELDEYSIGEGWAFGRVGDAYVAITASTGIELVKEGTGAYRELRSRGSETAWICQLGCSEVDGDLEAFRRKVLGSDLDVDGLIVRYASADRGLVSFGWDEPLVVDGVEQPLDGFKHYDSPFCQCELGDTVMEVQQGGWMLRLELGE